MFVLQTVVWAKERLSYRNTAVCVPTSCWPIPAVSPYILGPIPAVNPWTSLHPHNRGPCGDPAGPVPVQLWCVSRPVIIYRARQ